MDTSALVIVCSGFGFGFWMMPWGFFLWKVLVYIGTQHPVQHVLPGVIGVAFVHIILTQCDRDIAGGAFGQDSIGGQRDVGFEDGSGLAQVNVGKEKATVVTVSRLKLGTVGVGFSLIIYSHTVRPGYS